MSTVTYDRRLAQSLEREGLLEGERVADLMGRREQSEGGLFELLVEEAGLEEKQLLGVAASDAGLCPIDLDRVVVAREVLELVSVDVAEKHQVFPVARIGSCLTLAVSDPFDVVLIDNLRIRLKSDIRTVLASPRAIRDAIDRYYRHAAQELEQLVGDAGEEEVVVKAEEEELDDVDLSEAAGETSPVVKLANMIIKNAIREGASDIHIEPFEHKVRVRFRQDGVLREILQPPRQLAGALASRIKIMASLDIAEKRKPQDGKFQVKLEGRAVDFRVSTLPVVHGEKIVMRVLDKGNLAKKLDSLGFSERSLEDFARAIRSPYGMILITGPTGSGKSTTLYSAVQEIYDDEINIVTVEDPVEYQLPGINQVPVNPKRGVTFATALRSILRQDPDVILIGEIRDAETIEIAVKAALTGHLVLSTLHTNDAASAITRMVDMGLDPFLVATSVVLVAAQRLCRRLCPHCKEAVEVPRERLLAVGFTEEEAASARIYRPVGCPRCHQGYRGRFAILETLPVTDAIKRLILDGRSALDIKEAALEEGMVTLRRAAIENALAGNTSLEEVLRVTLADH